MSLEFYRVRRSTIGKTLSKSIVAITRMMVRPVSIRSNRKEMKRIEEEIYRSPGICEYFASDNVRVYPKVKLGKSKHAETLLKLGPRESSSESTACAGISKTRLVR